MQKGKQALLLHLGVCLCSTVLLPCRRFYFIWPRFPTLPSNLNLFLFPFPTLSLFSFIPHISVIFSISYPYARNIHLPLLYFIYLFSPLPLFQPQLIFSLLLVMLQRSCGNSGIMPVVLWPWPGGQFLGPEGCCFSSLYPQTRGYWAVSWGWKDEQLDGWRPVGASRGHRGHHHWKPWLAAQRYGVKEDHASGVEKELLFPCGSQRTQPCSQPSRLSPKQQPHRSLVMWLHFLCSYAQQQELLHLCCSIAIIYGVYF